MKQDEIEKLVLVALPTSRKTVDQLAKELGILRPLLNPVLKRMVRHDLLEESIDSTDEPLMFKVKVGKPSSRRMNTASMKATSSRVATGRKRVPAVGKGKPQAIPVMTALKPVPDTGLVVQSNSQSAGRRLMDEFSDKVFPEQKLELSLAYDLHTKIVQSASANGRTAEVEIKSRLEASFANQLDRDALEAKFAPLQHAMTELDEKVMSIAEDRQLRDAIIKLSAAGEGQSLKEFMCGLDQKLSALCSHLGVKQP